MPNIYRVMEVDNGQPKIGTGDNRLYGHTCEDVPMLD